jgi:hypothetical protein
MEQLLAHLGSLPPGQIADVGQLAALLRNCWDQFVGSDAEGMEPGKLLGRMEKTSWDPPVLSFTLERHGGTVLGSSRAELQRWEVNVETRSATCGTCGHRQLTSMQPKLNVKPLAEEIVGLILEGRHDNRLKWNADGSVRVVIGKVEGLQSGSAVQQTLAGRRRRVREEVERLLTSHGWHEVRTNVYAPTPS